MRDADPFISLPLSPFQSVGAVRVFDSSGAAILLPSTSYAARPTPDCARISFASAPPTPGIPRDGIEIDIAVGYGDNAQDVPEPLRRAMTMLTTRWYENRGDGDAGDMRLPQQVIALATPFRRDRLI